MGMLDLGLDVLKFARQLGIEERLLLTTRSGIKPSVADETMNLIYNACDVGLNTASWEGWGLVAFEHAATGAAQILPGDRVCEELWQGIGLLAPQEERMVSGNRTWEVSVPQVVSALDKMYSDRNLLQRKSEEAYVYATAPRFQWSNIAATWEVLFRDTLAS